MWEEDDRAGCKYVPMTSEELAEPATPRRPSRVRNTPDVGQETWHPILSQSEHAYGWWMLSPDEQNLVIDTVKARSERAATSRLAPPKAKSSVNVKKENPSDKSEGTTSKSGSSSAIPPAKAITTTVVSTSGQPAIVPIQGLISKELKSPPPQSVQSSSASMREQSNPRGKTEGGGIFSLANRGRPTSMGQGTPSVAPDQAKGAVPRPPSLSTPPRSRSTERHRSTSTPRTETTQRSRSEERSDGKGDDRTPTRPTTQTAMSWLDSSRRQSSAEPPREAPATSEGLGPILIGSHDQQPSAPPPEEENRSSSPGMISRAISAAEQYLPLAILEEVPVLREGDPKREHQQEHHNLHQETVTVTLAVMDPRSEYIRILLHKEHGFQRVNDRRCQHHQHLEKVKHSIQGSK